MRFEYLVEITDEEGFTLERFVTDREKDAMKVFKEYKEKVEEILERLPSLYLQVVLTLKPE